MGSAHERLRRLESLARKRRSQSMLPVGRDGSRLAYLDLGPLPPGHRLMTRRDVAELNLGWIPAVDDRPEPDADDPLGLLARCGA